MSQHIDPTPKQTDITSLNSNLNPQVLTSSEGIKTVALDRTRCPENSVRWFNTRSSLQSELPAANEYGIARVTKRLAGSCFIEMFTDAGAIWRISYDGATWTEWDQLLLKTQTGKQLGFTILTKSTQQSAATVTFTTEGRGAGLLFISQNGIGSSAYEIYTTSNDGDIAYSKLFGTDVPATASENVLSLDLRNWSNAGVIYSGVIL